MSNGPTQSQQTKSAPATLLRRLLTCFSLDWLALIVDVYGFLAQLFSPSQNGPYEILDYEATLELCDGSGRAANFSKRQKVRFLQDNTIAYQDFVWSSGSITGYITSRGHVADRYQEGGRWHILISLRETKNKGDVEEFHIEYAMQETFLHNEEWWQVEIRNPARRVKMAIIFPKERRCRRAVLSRRHSHRPLPLGAECFSELPDGRQILRWETNKSTDFELYTIRWWW
jgi:hypothetical protein